MSSHGGIAEPVVIIAQDAIRTGNDAEIHLSPAFFIEERGKLELAVDEDLGALLDPLQSIHQLAEAAYREESSFAVAAAHGQAEIAEAGIALLRLPDLGVVRGVTDEIDGYSLIIQIPSPPF